MGRILFKSGPNFISKVVRVYWYSIITVSTVAQQKFILSLLDRLDFYMMFRLLTHSILLRLRHIELN